MPLLQAAGARGETARVVNLSSMANVLAPSHGISLHDLGAAADYDPLARHGESRLASILHAKEISRRYGAAGVVGVAVNPGAVPPASRGGCFGGIGQMASHLFSSSPGSHQPLASGHKLKKEAPQVPTSACWLGPAPAHSLHFDLDLRTLPPLCSFAPLPPRPPTSESSTSPSSLLSLSSFYRPSTLNLFQPSHTHPPFCVGG